MNVVTFPGGFMCGTCGYPMASETLEIGAKVAVIHCQSFKCAEKDVRYLLPGTVVAVELADPPEIEIPALPPPVAIPAPVIPTGPITLPSQVVSKAAV